MIRKSCAVGVLALLLAGAAGAGRAQDRTLAQLYGRGVHAFFSGEYEQAAEVLGQAIQRGTQDPRVYYFRGLANKRLGRAEAAIADYKKAAELELSNDERFYAVSEALQRIQGRERLEIERYRKEARVAARERMLKRIQARYERLRRAEQEVLRRPERPPVAEIPIDPNKLKQPDPTDPFGAEAGPALATGEAEEAEAPKLPEEALAPPPEEAAPAAPLAEGTAAPAAPAAEGANPFEAPPPGAGGGPPAAPEEADPFAAPPAGEENPFGGAALPAQPTGPAPPVTAPPAGALGPGAGLPVPLGPGGVGGLVPPAIKPPAPKGVMGSILRALIPGGSSSATDQGAEGGAGPAAGARAAPGEAPNPAGGAAPAAPAGGAPAGDNPFAPQPPSGGAAGTP